MFAVFKREFKSFFQGVVGYVVMAVFLIIAGAGFFLYNVYSGSASIATMLGQLQLWAMLVIPLLTMKLFSDERRLKTDQLLLTSPVSLWGITIGKFLATCAFFFIMMAITFVYVAIIDIFGTPAYNEVFTGYLGFFLLACALISMGVFASTITENQIVAAIVTLLMILFVNLAGSLAAMVSDMPILYYLFKMVDVYGRFYNFSYSIISLSDVIYMLSYTGVFLYLTVYNIEKRRWSEG
ncbi:MAG: hypothetical protein E7334_09105 [Clostridiales bacterium]|nr:hypothetical protein [Clostridiales bacterium]MBQ2816703.1 ABC transporter permease subunit [Clostridia bacterium]